MGIISCRAAQSAGDADLISYQSEIQELAVLSRQLSRAVVDWDRGTVEELLNGLDGPLEKERGLENLVSRLRHRWLTAAAEQTSRSFRSPKEGDTPTTPRGKLHDFGYERELCPIALEQRCSGFFEAPPIGVHCRHVLFSSGQAAVTACLLLIEGPGRVRHLGGYFETPQLIELVQSSRGQRFVEPESTVIAEPVWFNGDRWGSTNVRDIDACRPEKVIVDATLLGLHYKIGPLLSALPASVQTLRLHSGLKLFQYGLELADVGIVTIFDHDEGRADHTANALRKVRALCGLGLRFAEIAALELPSFLNRKMTIAYEARIFVHNARFAQAIAKSNQLFDEEVHPVAGSIGRKAPYCILRLRNPSNAAYERLEQRIREGVEQYSILLERGGSFGFRGHRYELVQPESGPAFVRVALGRRQGVSLERTIALFEGIASRANI